MGWRGRKKKKGKGETTPFFLNVNRSEKRKGGGEGGRPLPVVSWSRSAPRVEGRKRGREGGKRKKGGGVLPPDGRSVTVIRDRKKKKGPPGHHDPSRPWGPRLAVRLQADPFKKKKRKKKKGDLLRWSLPKPQPLPGMWPSTEASARTFLHLVSGRRRQRGGGEGGKGGRGGGDRTSLA